MPRRIRRHTVIVALAALTLALGYGGIDYAGRFAHVDLQYYRALAQAAPTWDLSVPQPYVFRILAPWLVGLLPVPDPLGFRVLSLLGCVVVCVALYAFQHAFFPIRSSVAAFTAVLFALNPYLFGFFAFDYFQLADLLALLFIVAGFTALYRQRYVVLAVVLLLGVLSREPVILVIPAAAIYLWERGCLRAQGRRLTLAVLPALIVFIGLRLIITPSGGPGLGQTFLNASGKAARPETWYRLLVNAWAPLSLLPLIFWRTTYAFFRRRPHLLVFSLLVLVSCFFGGDQERLIAPAFVAAYPLFGRLIGDHLWARFGLRAVLAGAAFLTSLHHLTARFPLPSRRWTMVLSVVALTAVSVAAWWNEHGRGAVSRTRAS